MEQMTGERSEEVSRRGARRGYELMPGRRGRLMVAGTREMLSPVEGI